MSVYFAKMKNEKERKKERKERKLKMRRFQNLIDLI